MDGYRRPKPSKHFLSYTNQGYSLAVPLYDVTLASSVMGFSFNATVFATIGANSYRIYTVNPGVFSEDHGKIFANNSVFSTTDFPYQQDFATQGGEDYSESDLVRYVQDECIDLFARSFVSDRRFVILELDRNEKLNHTVALTFNREVNANESIDPKEKDLASFFDGETDSYSWICFGNGRTGPINSTDSGNCDPLEEKGRPTWRPFGYNISGCYSHTYEEHCKLEMASQLAIMVVVITFAQALVLLLLAFIPRPTPLLTIGDAISSFLEDPDPNTAQMAFAQFGKRAMPWAWTFSPLMIYGLPRLNQKKIHAAGVSSTDLALRFTILILLAIHGLQSMFSSGSLDGITYLTDLGFGAINVRTLITGWTVSQSAARGVWENTMIANAAQPLLSLLYFLYNGQLTAVYLGTEWDGYGVTAKGLRVSGIPRGVQRGTHFLQLPFRYSVPLAAASGLLHWLASQSLFAVSLVLDGERAVFTCGYSPLALLCLLAALFLLPAVLLSVVLPRFGNGVPVAGSCRLVIVVSGRALCRFLIGR
ncbi:hypothetical protein SLS56_008948 [Neofusicoccum ribis]|uniref:Uncharacterized protein n=1 Tax=Neofusicoccum ribis TaxID=45134 RepID=A0ABR3SJK3_9PEZI